MSKEKQDKIENIKSPLIKIKNVLKKAAQPCIIGLINFGPVIACGIAWIIKRTLPLGLATLFTGGWALVATAWVGGLKEAQQTDNFNYYQNQETNISRKEDEEQSGEEDFELENSKEAQEEVPLTEKIENE